MRLAAILKSNIVENVIVIPEGAKGDKELESRNAIEVTGQNIDIGDSYDGKTFVSRPKTKGELEAEEAEAEKQAKLESAKAKLTALGLDEAEVQAILGL